jgi:ribonuclease-3
VYLDQGFETSRSFVQDQVLASLDLQEIAQQDENYKSQLLERMQAEGHPQPTYRVVEESGPSHDKTFTVEVQVGDASFEQGTAGSKQEAEQQAARRTLERIAADASTA